MIARIEVQCDDWKECSLKEEDGCELIQKLLRLKGKAELVCCASVVTVSVWEGP